MRKELIIGVAVSVGVHAGFLLGFNSPSVVKKKASGPQDDLIQIQMPTLPPEPPEKSDDAPPPARRKIESV